MANPTDADDDWSSGGVSGEDLDDEDAAPQPASPQSAENTFMPPATQRQLLWVLRQEADRRGMRRPPECIVRRLSAASVADRLTHAACTLDLSGEYLGPRAVCCIAALMPHLPLLQTLSLRGAGMYAADATAISNPQVRGNDAVDAIASMAETHPSLTALDLSNNTLGTVGAKRVLHALERNSRLRCVDIGGSNIDTRTRQIVDDQLRRNLQGRNPNTPSQIYNASIQLPPDTDCEVEEGRALRRNRRQPNEWADLCPAVRNILQECAAPAAEPESLTAGSVSADWVWVVTAGYVVVTVEEPERGRAVKGRVPVTLRLQAGDLLPYLSATAPTRIEPPPAPQGWGGVDADAVQLSEVLKGSAVTVTTAVAEPGAGLWRATASAAAPTLCKHISSALPALAATHLLRPLGWAELLWVADRTELRHYDPGDDIVAQGSEWDGLHFIIRGSVAVERTGSGGEWLEERSLDTGDAIGATGAARYAMACVARTEVDTLHITATSARRLLSMPKVCTIAAAAEA